MSRRGGSIVMCLFALGVFFSQAEARLNKQKVLVASSGAPLPSCKEYCTKFASEPRPKGMGWYMYCLACCKEGHLGGVATMKKGGVLDNLQADFGIVAEDVCQRIPRGDDTAAGTCPRQDFGTLAESFAGTDLSPPDSVVGVTGTQEDPPHPPGPEVAAKKCDDTSQTVIFCSDEKIASPGDGRIINLGGETPAFEVLMVGTKGGVASEDLSSYMITLAGDEADKGYIMMDGGSFHHGLEKERTYGNIPSDDPEIIGKFWHTHLKAIFIGHTHLDHNAGTLIAMTENFMKRKLTMYAQEWTLAKFKDVFNDVLWPKPLQASNPMESVEKINYDGGDEMTAVDVHGGKKIYVGAIPICHGAPSKPPTEPDDPKCLESAAFVTLDSTKKDAIVYLSDVGPFRSKPLEAKCVPDFEGLQGWKDTFTGTSWTEACSDTSEDECKAHTNGCVYIEAAGVSEFNPTRDAASKYYGNDYAVVDGVLHEHNARMFDLLRYVAKHVLCAPDKSLKAFFMESAYTKEKPEPVFGHLTPTTYMGAVRLLGRLAMKTCPDMWTGDSKHPPLNGVTFVVTHIKPYFDAAFKKYHKCDKTTGDLEGGDECSVMEATALQFKTMYDALCGGVDNDDDKKTCRGAKFLIPTQGQKVVF